jgi:plasmid stability protein
MASMTIRDLDDRLKQRLRIQAARNNRSMEEEARAILKAALSGETGSSRSLYRSIRARIEPLGGVDLMIAPRGPIRPIEIE